MNPKTTKLIAGALLVGVIGIWVPQLLSAGAPPTGPAKMDLAADGTPHVDVSSGENGPIGAPIATDGVMHSSDPAPSGEPADKTTAELDRKIAMIHALVPERTGQDLDTLAAAWNLDVDAHRATLDPRDATREPDARSVESATSEERARVRVAPTADPIDVFLASHPLTGVLFGEKTRIASLGSIVAREGDEIHAGLRVVTIGPRWVELARNGALVRIEIQAFQARPRPIVGGGESSGATNSATTSPPSGGATSPTGETENVGATLEALKKLVDAQASASASATTSATDKKTSSPKSGAKKD